MDLALNNFQWLVCHKSKPSQTKRVIPWNNKIHKMTKSFSSCKITRGLVF